MQVGMTDLYVKYNRAIYGVVTLGEYRELASLAALPEDYDQWIRRIERNRALHGRYGDKFDPWRDD